jgi:hypothetical protein
LGTTAQPDRRRDHPKEIPPQQPGTHHRRRTLDTTTTLPARGHPAQQRPRCRGPRQALGLPVSRITTLQHHDIHTDPASNSWLCIAHHTLLLPAAVAALLHSQRDHGTGAAMLARNIPSEHQRLFPGGLPGRPSRDGLYRALCAHLPVHLRRAHSAALAALAASIPAAVLAQLLDVNINTAIAWAEAHGPHLGNREVAVGRVGQQLEHQGSFGGRGPVAVVRGAATGRASLLSG